MKSKKTKAAAQKKLKNPSKSKGLMAKVKAASKTIAKAVKKATTAKPAPKAEKKADGLKADKKLKAGKAQAAPVAETKTKEAPELKGNKKKAMQEMRAQMSEALEQMAGEQEEVETVLTNSKGERLCKATNCDEVATTTGHCRFHYIVQWKRNKNKLKILGGGMLERYIEELTSKYPDKFVDIMRKDLASEKDFNALISEMEMENVEEEAFEEESRVMEEVRSTIFTETSGSSTDDDY